MRCSRRCGRCAVALKDDALTAFRFTLPVAAAYVPLGMALGIFAVDEGLAWYWPVIAATILYAGSAEFLAIGMIASGASVVQAAVNAFVVNYRHVFYGLSFPLHRMNGPAARAYGVFALTDEAYAVTSAGPGARMTGRQLLLFQVFIQVWWVSGAAVGALLGQFIPDEITGFDFAMTAMFTVLAVQAALRVPHKLFYGAITAVAIAAAFAAERLVHPDLFLLAGLITYLALISAGYAYAQREERGGRTRV